jgi:hypothetical protein
VFQLKVYISSGTDHNTSTRQMTRRYKRPPGQHDYSLGDYQIIVVDKTENSTGRAIKAALPRVQCISELLHVMWFMYVCMDFMGPRDFMSSKSVFWGFHGRQNGVLGIS